MLRICFLAGFLLGRFLLYAQGSQKSEESVSQFFYEDNNELVEVLVDERKSKNRKVIVDLFASNCVVCFQMMPKVQALQNEFEGSLKMVLVGKYDQDVEKVYRRFAVKFGLSLPVIYDSILFERNEISSIPKYIWLDENGTVRHVTGPEKLTAENIKLFLSDQPLASSHRAISRGADSTLINFGKEDKGLITGARLSIWDSSRRAAYPKQMELSKKGPFFQAVGVTLADLYRYAYFGWAWWAMQDSVYGRFWAKPMMQDLDSLLLIQRYTFEVADPSAQTRPRSLQELLKSVLSTSFGLTAQVVERPMPCYKLVVLPGREFSLRSKYSEQLVKLSYSSVNYRHVRVASILKLLTFSNENDYPIIDATGITYPIDFIAEVVLYDRGEMQAALRKAGLDLILGEEQMSVLKLSKKNK